jgi:tetratricopeptide (TPR) repeat protein
MTSTMNADVSESPTIENASDDAIDIDSSLAQQSGHRRGPTPLRPRATVAVFISALFIAGVVAVINRTSNDDGRAAVVPATVPATVLGVGPATLDGRIRSLEREVRLSPQDGNAWMNLAAVHIRKVYETGDPSSYSAAQLASTKARTLLRDSPESLLVAANLALSQHRFREALDLTDRVHAQQPNRAAVLIPLIDASVETGNYVDAATYMDQLMQLRPSVAALSRSSYLRQLRGDITGAAADMRQAIQAAPDASLDRAVALGYLGDVKLESGDLRNAQRAYDQALAIRPRLPHAVIGRASVDAALGLTDAAAKRLDELIGQVPLPGAIALRAEIARSVNDTKSASASDELLDATVKLYEASGSVLDSEFALALADRGDPLAVKMAVAVAQRAYKERRTIFTSDAMAWSLFRAGRFTEALPYANEAIATDASVAMVHAHAALVFAAAGDAAGTQREFRLARQNPALLFPLSRLLDDLAKASPDLRGATS